MPRMQCIQAVLDGLDSSFSENDADKGDYDVFANMDREDSTDDTEEDYEGDKNMDREDSTDEGVFPKYGVQESSKSSSLCIDQSDLELNRKRIEETDSNREEADLLENDLQSQDKDWSRLDKLSILEENAAKYFGQKINKKKTNAKDKRKTKKKIRDVLDTSFDESGRDDENFLSKIRVEDVREALRNADKRSEKVDEKWRKEYPRWMFYLSQNFNVLLYGLGSKVGVLDDFCEQQLSDVYSHFKMRAYDADFKLKEALVQLAAVLNINVAKLHSVVDISQKIQTNCANDFDVILIIYNIDGTNIRDEESQTALSLLTEVPNLHLIASVDHVNASSLWNLEMLARFRFLWTSCSTRRSYAREIFAANQSSALSLSKRRNTCAHNVASLRSVWSSLTENARAIMILLAEEVARETLAARKCKRKASTRHSNVAESSDSDESVVAVAAKYSAAGLPAATVTFWDLYNSARDKFLVSSEAALR